MKINRTYARRLLLRGDVTPHRSLKIRDTFAEKQAQLMLEASFLEATSHDGRENPVTITHSGHALLVVPPVLLAIPPFSEPAPPSPVLEKWRLNFGQLDASRPLGSLRNHPAEPEETA